MNKQDYRDAVRHEHECSRCDSIFYGNASRVFCGVCIDGTQTDEPSALESSANNEVVNK